jgi:branched-chain amino acid transport system substrate-binding protein
MKNVLTFGIAAAFASIAIMSAVSAKDGRVKIGVLTDMSGGTADLTGEGSVLATRMAIEEFGGNFKGNPIEVVSADHQNKPDVASSIARNWVASDVDAIIDVPNSAIALAVNGIVRDANKVMLHGSLSTRFTGDACTPNAIQWTTDAYALANGTATSVVEAGGKKWFFITSDYVFGIGLEKQVGDLVKASGGQVVGSVRAPLNTNDYSSFLIQAQASGANVIGLAMAGADPINAIKQAHEYQIDKSGIQMVALSLYIMDVYALGVDTAQGLIATDAFYWDLNDDTRAFAKKFAARHKGRMPTLFQAAAYSSTLHYLKAAQALGDENDGAKVVAKMKELPTQDLAFGAGTVRIDGKKLHPVYTFKVKSKAESKGEWDLYSVLKKTPPEQAFLPPSKECSLVK